MPESTTTTITPPAHQPAQVTKPTRPLRASTNSEGELIQPEVDPAVRRFRLTALLFLTGVVIIALPALNLMGLIDTHNMNRIGRYMCFVLVALGIDLIWGYTGVLSLCQAFFFCLGGYAIGMHLSLPEGGGDVRPEYNNIPQFFHFSNVRELPLFWEPFASLPFAIAAGMLIPATIAGVFGFFIFRSRVRGVYFAIITQALAWAAALTFARNELLLGGSNGLTNFNRSLNQSQVWVLGLYLLTAGTIIVAFLGCRSLTRSRLGRILIATRDNESRLRFAGYRPEWFKLFVFIIAAVLAGVGGMLYVPQNGIITPNLMRVEDSIWMIVWVALGGRGRLWGAVFGAMVVGLTYSMMTSDLPQAWPFIQGAMFLAVVLLFPNGLVGLWDKLEKEIAAGRNAYRVLIAMLLVFTVFLLDRKGIIPDAMRWPADVRFDLPYWLLAAALLVTLWGRVAVAAIPLATIFVFILADAVGAMPNAMRADFLGLPMKYPVVIAILAAVALYYLIRDGRQHAIDTLQSNLASLRTFLGGKEGTQS
ncbi:urea ABC transporter permease subunit UrtC [Phycisphaerales bacterium AB-hyl4]|uniref:Urea ABC transporter permease subunit UrtC n=1 Tax=Natronomicrosphaera hydrolytica TaxID=3242702 RepID=A0ABV4U9G1_9BACT